MGFQTSEGAAAELAELEGWDGSRVELPSVQPSAPLPRGGDGLVLATWKTMIADGPMQEGDPHYLASGPVPTAVMSERTLAAAGVHEGEPVALSTERGSVMLTARAGDMDDGVVWAPSASGGINLLRDLGARSGSRVSVAAVGTEPSAASVGAGGSAGHGTGEGL